MKIETKIPFPFLVLGSKTFYERVFSKSFKESFELFYFDHQGFKSNPAIKESAYTALEEIVSEIEQFRVQNSLNRFLLFGHSGHAYMALEYAKAYPERLAGLVLCACSPDLSSNTHAAAERYFQTTADDSRKRVFAQDITKLQQKVQTDPENRFVHFVLSQKAKNWFNPHYDPAWLWEGVPTHLPTLDFVWGKLFSEYQLIPGTENIKCPVLILQGTFDFAVGPSTLWTDFLSSFSNLQFNTLPSSGHYPMLEEPEGFLKVLMDWWNMIS